MHRLLFEKTGDAVWISHLDLMRVFQRAFKRAGLPLTHTKGYNPRPSVSIALPLSVGVESVCELLDYELDSMDVPCCEIPQRLNACLIPGVKVLEAYEDGRKLRELTHMEGEITLTYDNGVPQSAEEEIRNLFERETLTAPKKTKSGLQEQDIIPMLKRVKVARTDDKYIVLNAVFCCQNPTLNPMQLALAVGIHLPALAPNHSTCRRLNLFDANETVFR